MFMAASVSAGDDGGLCPSIWNNLPAELAERVLQWVPFSSLIRFRLVCKQWNSLIMSSEFNRGCLQQQSRKCVPVLVPTDIVESTGWSINPYNASDGSWLSVSLSFLQSASRNGPLYLTASSGGLMCFESVDRRNFTICNPFTKQWTRLELPSDIDEVSPDADYRQTLTGLVVDHAAGTYKLIVASLANKSDRATMLYDSATRRWSRGMQVPKGKRFVNPGALTCNGSIYCLVKNGRGLEERSCIWRLVKYDVEHDNWKEVPVETGWPGTSSTELELLEHGRQVLLVARVLNRRWLPNNTFYRVWYNTFYRVFESASDREMQLVQERRLFQALDKSIGNPEFKTRVTKYPGSFVGQGNLIYTTGVPCGNSNEVQVLKVLMMNSINQNCSILPEWRREEPKSKMQMEIRLLEPSLIAAV